MNTITVLVVAATPIMRAGVQSLLAQTPDITVVGEAMDRSSLTTHLSRQAPSVVLVCTDQELRMTASEVTHLVKTLRPTSKILLLAAGPEREALRAAIVAGTEGYLPSGMEPEALAQGIRDVVRYGLILAEDVARLVRSPASARKPVDTLAMLSVREREVLQHLAQGQTNLEIARELRISGDTVRTHLKHIYAKLEVESRAALIWIALQAGLGEAVRLSAPEPIDHE
jgi:DNA-binding NarL/FixJ family response regulator